MLSFNYSILFISVSTVLFSYLIAPPVQNDNPYNTFIGYLAKYNCSMPPEIKLPFSQSTDDESPFSYLNNPLKECQTSDASTENDEAKFLCNEIFELIENITCPEYGAPLPKIESKPLSNNVCNDLKSMADIFPKGDDYLSGKLVDSTLCKLFCTKEKYELLCKTLLWSYDIQTKIKSAFEINEDKDVDKNTASKTSTPSIKVKLTYDSPDSTKQTIDKNIGDKTHKGDKKINLDNIHTEVNKTKTGSDLNIVNSTSSDKTTSDKVAILTNKIQTDEKITKIASTSEDPKTSVVSNDESKADKKIPTQNGLLPESNKKPQTEDNDSHKNEVNVDTNSNNIKGHNVPVNPVNNVKSETSNAKDGTKDNSLNNLQGEESTINVSHNTKSESNDNSDNAIPQDSGIDNELNNVNIDGEEKEGKDRQMNSKTGDGNKEIENPNLADVEHPVDSPDVNSKQPESTTVQFLQDKDEDDEQGEKDQEQYNDSENEGDYPKSEYDNASLNNKDSDAKNSVIEEPKKMLNNYDTVSSLRNNNRRMPDDIQVIPSFPEQEDSNFFFYFLSIVLILMAGYLIFHNKQKIIALIVEGRHERRRRSHGAGYKKLETK